MTPAQIAAAELLHAFATAVTLIILFSLGMMLLAAIMGGRR